jgi:hypothetical protein
MHFERDKGNTRRIIQAVDAVYPDYDLPSQSLESAEIEAFECLANIEAIEVGRAVDFVMQSYRIILRCGPDTFKYVLKLFGNHCRDWDESLSDIGTPEYRSKQAVHKEMLKHCENLEQHGFGEIAALIRSKGRVEV